jgi:hypothetical protein
MRSPPPSFLAYLYKVSLLYERQFKASSRGGGEGRGDCLVLQLPEPLDTLAASADWRLLVQPRQAGDRGVHVFL